MNKKEGEKIRPDKFVGCEYISRYSKGDQLYNMPAGIAIIPFGEDLFTGSISGILSKSAKGYEPMEYSKYPFQSAKIRDIQTNQYNNFYGIS